MKRDPSMGGSAARFLASYFARRHAMLLCLALCLGASASVVASPLAKHTQSPGPASTAATAMATMTNHLIYQPHGRDSALSKDQWQLLWKNARAHGVTTMIIQWTRHGNDEFGGQDGWLARALRLAENAGLSLILGLVHDPQYYEILPNNARFSSYWYNQLSQSAKQQKHLIETWSLSPVGWYLPLELDDWLFKDDRVRRELEQQLASASKVLKGPLHLSMFTGGFLTPEVYAEWANTLAGTGWHIWWQDGEGTQQLLPAVRRAYRRALPCQVGIISEAFSQVSKEDEPFRAVSAPIVDMPDGCHPRATFSLRYLPWAKPLLHDNN